MPYLARTYQLKHSLLYHIINRGNARSEVFHEEKDYRFYIDLLKKYSNTHNFNIYHWVLMPNHYHLLIEIEKPENLSKVMAGLTRSYVYYYHKKYQTSGHLWQGRFKSQPIQKELYLLTCGRYIERNPVKAGIVKKAEDYPYSSAAYYVYGSDDSLTTEDPIFEDLSNDPLKRREKYREFLLDFNTEEDLIFSNLETPQGSEEFKRRLIKENGLFVSKRRGRPYN